LKGDIVYHRDSDGIVNGLAFVEEASGMYTRAEFDQKLAEHRAVVHPINTHRPGDKLAHLALSPRGAAGIACDNLCFPDVCFAALGKGTAKIHKKKTAARELMPTCVKGLSASAVKKRVTETPDTEEGIKILKGWCKELTGTTPRGKVTRDTLVARIAQAAAAKYVLHISWVMGLGGACLFDCNLLKLSVDMLDVLQMMQRVCLMRERTHRILWQHLNEMATFVLAFIANSRGPCFRRAP
jgi:hypothetical protein